MNFKDLRHVFKEYDIRGKAGNELDFGFARRLGWAYAAFVGAEKGSFVSVGLDVRLSSPELRDGLCKGLNEAGLNVYDIGMVPTPILYYSLWELPVVGGIMITASHNPPDENGFKVAVERETIASHEIEKLFEIFQSAENPIGSGNIEKIDMTSRYQERILNEFEYLKTKPKVRIAIDSGNGSAGQVALSILNNIGCQVTALYCDPDGTFPNHQPDPTVPDLMKDLSDTVIKGKLDLGLGFDGDGDRLGVVDENGELLWGDRLLILFERQILQKKPGVKIIGEVKCTDYLFKDIERNGGVPIMWKAGHSLVKKKMREEKAAFGGEMSGHFFFADRYFGYDDAIYTACRVIEILKEAKGRGETFSLLLADLPNLSSTGEVRLSVPEDKKFKLVEDLKESLEKMEIPGFSVVDVIDIDGIRVNFDHGWALLRPSNTQAAVVLRLEADSKEGLERLEKYFLGTVENKIREL